MGPSINNKSKYEGPEFWVGGDVIDEQPGQYGNHDG